MTRIVLLLTAFPLAAVLGLLLNRLLDQRLAPRESPARTGRTRRLPGALSIAVALLVSGAAARALADDSRAEPCESCGSIGCSLVVDAASVARLWERPSASGVVLVAQSRIPVAFEPELDRWDGAGEDTLVAQEPEPVRASPAKELPSTRP